LGRNPSDLKNKFVVYFQKLAGTRLYVTTLELSLQKLLVVVLYNSLPEKEAAQRFGLSMASRTGVLT
jgi:hypothetical protein